MGQVERVEVVEYTDVMCSWAWGSEPKLRLLRWRYEDRCDWRLVMGGLVSDRTKNPAWDPLGPVSKTIAFWAQVASHTGASYPVHLQWVYGYRFDHAASASTWASAGSDAGAAAPYKR